MTPYLDVHIDEDPYLDVHIDEDPYLEVQINEDPYLYYVQINDDSLPRCLQILSLNAVSSGAILQQPGFCHHIGRRGSVPIIPPTQFALSSMHGLVLLFILQMLIFNVVSSGVMPQQLGLSHHVGGRKKREKNPY